MSEATMTRPEAQVGRLWAFVPATILASLIGLQLWLVGGALSDPSFAVEDDYYAKAVSWDAKMAQDRENARLGFRADALLGLTEPGRARITVRLLDAKNRALAGAHVTVEAFSIARSTRVARAPMTEGPAGEYSAAIPAATLGQWELRFDVHHDSDHFTSTERHDLSASGPPR